MWQRFGRAGRNKAIKATAVLIAEKSYFDEQKTLKEKCKRKAEEKLKSSKPTKKICLTKSEPSPKLEVPASMLDPPTPILDALAAPASVNVKEMERAMSALYNRVPVESWGGKGKTDNELEPVLDHFINAKSRPSIHCHRKPVNIYFGNTKLGACPCLCCGNEC
jgi:hypothetical protein